MDWDKLKSFHAAAEAGSLTAAGERLGISQSAVSRQIAALEEQLGVSLFQRHARGLVLTDAGHNRRALERLVKDYQDREAARWRWQHFELQLIRSQDLGTLLDLLLRQAERYFGLESAVLELLDLDHSWSKCLERGPQPQSPHLLLTEDPATLERRFPLGVKVRVIRRDDGDGRTLLIPLVRQGAGDGCAGDDAFRSDDQTLDVGRFVTDSSALGDHAFRRDGQGVGHILSAFQRRIDHDRATEFAEACRQVERIAELRLIEKFA